ncbi:hypothetical protein ACSVDM_00995 [Nocardia sp. JW2]|uniref:hypothetical protein n=1 Tax=Nocardia sp. JW2 TaxID=3450738 RepID=UPI003F4449C6
MRNKLGTASWDEHDLVAGDPGYEFCRHPALANVIQVLVGRITIGSVMCWMSHYGVGEYIGPHRDRYGRVQLLVCLKTTNSIELGGSLVLAGTELFLAPGDAVIFEATELEHHTTPLLGSTDDPSPTRSVLVGRYYAEQ